MISLLLAGLDVTDEIRSEAGGMNASKVSTLPAVRDKYAVPAYHCVAALPAPPPLPDLGRL
jgi:3-phosphoshikimate 1-carboxyvinyltransferase